MKFKKILTFIFLLLASFTFSACQSEKLEGIEGKWILGNNSLMIINYDEFYWYQNYQNTKTNYYYGASPEILTGNEALDRIQVPSENKASLLETHTYYLSVLYTEYSLNNKDLSQNLKNSPSEFAFQITGKNQLSIVNLLTNEQFTAKREVQK